jgi:pyruvate formate lyase activating enzyme
MQKPKEAMVFDIQSFSLHDGPGIRTAVFMKGCNLNCFWCHNPESWNTEPELQFYQNKCISCGTCAVICPNNVDGKPAMFTENCELCAKCAQNCYSQAIMLAGYKISVPELMKKLLSDRDIFEQSGGGVTFTGGEPLLQGDFLLEALQACKKENISTAVETALCAPWKAVESVLPYVDLMMCDIKTVNDQKHVEGTGQSNRLILENIKGICEAGANVLFRTPVIPGFNDDTESMNEIAGFIKLLENLHKIELLPFHGICSGKYSSLNRSFKAEALISPTREKMNELAGIFVKNNISVII